MSGLVTIEIPERKIDNKSAVFATNTRVFDVPIIREREFDSDDLEGVIDDLDNPYDQTIPVTVDILRKAIVSYSKNRLK